ncbi:MAG TPA: glycosyltransferase family 2 protein [Gallicola sp.]|nr:glycosyltransferase family 2 protein [Gallicola sp.]
MSKLYQFSIIIPHFTKSDTDLLERAVASVPDDESLQVLVVDNSPLPIDANLFDKRKNVKILFSDNTKGAGHARNVGIDNAKGKWLLFLDADDFFVNCAFDVFKEHYESASDIVFFKMTSVFSDTLELASRHEPYEKIIDDYFETNNDYKLRCSYPSPCGKMVKTNLVKENSVYFDEVPASNDVIFGLKIGLIARNINVDKRVVYCATVQKGSLTNTVSLENIESRFGVNIRKNEMLKQNGYKKTESVIYFIMSSIRFGVKPFLKLFYKAFVTNNLFVGYDRWFKTLLSKRHLKNKEYKVKK